MIFHNDLCENLYRDNPTQNQMFSYKVNTRKFIAFSTVSTYNLYIIKPF